MNSPPKEKRGLGTALKTAQLRAAYYVFALIAKVFEKPFWFFEQRRSQLIDRIDNARSEQ